MKTTKHLFAILAMAAIGTLSACNDSTGPTASDPNSPVGTWTAAADVITLKADGTVSDLIPAGTISAVSPGVRNSGTWSVSGGNITLHLTKSESSSDGTTWTTISNGVDLGRTVPFAIDVNTMVLGTGTSALTYTRSATIPTNPTDPAATGGAALVGSWRQISTDDTSSPGIVSIDTSTLTFVSGGIFSTSDKYRVIQTATKTTLDSGAVTSTGTWSATATTLTTVGYGKTIMLSYTISGSLLTIVAPDDPTPQVFTKQ